MVQPKSPPISIRLSPQLLARVEAYAVARGLARNAAIGWLLEQALGAGPGMPTPERQAANNHTMAKAIASVPLAGTFERKPYQKGTKK